MSHSNGFDYSSDNIVATIKVDSKDEDDDDDTFLDDDDGASTVGIDSLGRTSVCDDEAGIIVGIIAEVVAVIGDDDTVGDVTVTDTVDDSDCGHTISIGGQYIEIGTTVPARIGIFS